MGTDGLMKLAQLLFIIDIKENISIRGNRSRIVHPQEIVGIDKMTLRAFISVDKCFNFPDQVFSIKRTERFRLTAGQTDVDESVDIPGLGNGVF